ncbi:MAG: von Willebrand factor type A domain-containing protein, partial [Abyssibacter sp.]|uniref:vWA domain-containing protein n=1 Tax=Abyssibacter sp. TaxID=2320200 RepID=UPI003219945F
DYAVAPRGKLQQALRMAAPAIAPMPPRPSTGFNREGYEAIAEHRFHDPRVTPLSTFGLDVDTASYANVRRLLNAGRTPPIDAVRIEELINYFDYSPLPVDSRHPIRLRSELTQAPWAPGHLLAMVQVAAEAPRASERPANRLVFLIDTSGSMQAADKLPMLQRAYRQLIEQLGPQDSVAIVTYAGQAGLVQPATSGEQKTELLHAINRLRAGGATAGAQGIELAYRIAGEQFDPEANNRVILATDGDFNVGASSQGELVRLIEAHRDQGIFLTVLGFGTGNYQDGRMHRLADHGDGNYYYIDSDLEARRVLVDKLQGTLITVAKDVKLQVEFNPEAVARYRLLGYETRALAAEDFTDDRKDAGDVGAGQRVTALYEIVPKAGHHTAPSPLRYQSQETRQPSNHSGEWMLIKARYKQPAGGASTELRQIVTGIPRSLDAASTDLQWAATVAEFGLVLRRSEHAGTATLSTVLQRAERLERSTDPLRQEFIGLVRQASALARAEPPPHADPFIARHPGR